jgi:hypothetical protein
MAGNPPTLRHTEAWHRQQAERQTLSAAQQRQTSLAMYPPPTHNVEWVTQWHCRYGIEVNLGIILDEAVGCN